MDPTCVACLFPLEPSSRWSIKISDAIYSLARREELNRKNFIEVYPMVDSPMYIIPKPAARMSFRRLAENPIDPRNATLMKTARLAIPLSTSDLYFPICTRMNGLLGLARVFTSQIVNVDGS